MSSDTNKILFITIILLVTVIFSINVSASLIPANNQLCQDKPIIKEQSDTYTIESSCFLITAPKNYHNEISFFDKLNKQSFDLKLYSIEEQNKEDIKQKRTTTFSSEDFNAKITEDSIIYSNPDETIKLIYRIENNKVKANLELKQFRSAYDVSNLYLNTRIKNNLDSKIKTKIEAISPIVNNKAEPLIVSDKVSGNNIFQEQLLFSGKEFDTLIIDPLYEIQINSTNPSYHLINGVINQSSDNQFLSKVNITSIMSDGNTNTKAYINVGTPYHESNTIMTFNLNQFSSQDTITYNDYVVDVFPTVLLQQQATEFYSNRFIGLPNHLLIGNPNDFQMNNNDFTFCAQFDSEAGTLDQYIMTLGDSANDGYRLYQRADENLRCAWEGASYQFIQFGSNNVHTTGWHTACCAKNSTHIRMWVDGNIVATNSVVVGSINTGTNSILTLGTTSTYEATRYFNGYIDGVAIYNKFLSEAEMDVFYNSRSFYNRSTGNALSIFFNHPIDAGEVYSFNINSDTEYALPIRIYAYQNMTHINYSNFKEYTINNQQNILPLNDFVGVGYNYPFRIESLSNRNISISEVYLNEIINDTSPPVFGDIHISDFLLDCDDDVIYLVDVTDDTSVYNVTIILNSTAVGQGVSIHLSPYNSTTWFFNLSSQEIYDIFSSIGWNFSDIVNISTIVLSASDVVGQNSYLYPNDVVEYTCLAECVEDWQPYLNSCLFNDTILVSYYDDNSCYTYNFTPIDNGTYTSCNYCTEDIEKVYIGDCELFNGSGKLDYEWQDNNYFSCCAITNLLSDCSILSSPYNETASDVCLFGLSEFILEMDNQALFGIDFTNNINNRIYGKINLANYSNNNFTCVSYVQDIDGNTIQINPIYDKNSQTLITLNNNMEDRQVFTTYNGIANVYWTQQNLVKDSREYLFGVECSDGTQTLKSEKVLQTGYMPLKDATTRTFWFVNQQNITEIILIIFGLVVGLFIIYAIFKR